MSLPSRVLHVVNYGWPAVDGYTVRTMGLLEAQRTHLGIEARVAASPFAPLTSATDPASATDHWGPEVQTETREHGARAALSWERPRLGIAPGARTAYREALREIVREFRPEVVHAHHPWASASVAREAAEAEGVPFVYELRCFNGDYDLDGDSLYERARGRWQNALEARLLGKTRTVVTISDGLRDRILGLGVPQERVHVVRNAVDTGRFAPSETASPDEPETLHVGYATTFEPMEGLDDLVRAIAIARPRLEAQGRRLRATIAGTGRDWDRISALVRELGLADTVTLPGLVPYGQMPDFYRSLDLFVVSRREAPVSADTTPLKPLEALACARPVLATDLPAMRELMGGREDVRFAAPGPDGLAAGMGDFAQGPWRGTGEIGDRAWRREIERYREVYAHALAPTSRDAVPA